MTTWTGYTLQDSKGRARYQIVVADDPDTDVAVIRLGQMTIRETTKQDARTFYKQQQRNGYSALSQRSGLIRKDDGSFTTPEMERANAAPRPRRIYPLGGRRVR